MIEISRLRVGFDGRPVLRDITLTIPEGQVMAIVGGSGCGKTVLLRSIIGLIRPDAGSIRVDGQEVTGLSRGELMRSRRRFGMLFQGAALFDSLNVLENVGLPLREHTRLENAAVLERVRHFLELVGLSGIESKMPAELSGGMRKRVGLARALIMDPRYMLFDEPTTGLDPIMSDAIDRLILETQRRLHFTAVIVTHDMASVYRVADRIAMIDDGIVIFEGSVKAFRQSRIPRVRRFVLGRNELEAA